MQPAVSHSRVIWGGEGGVGASNKDSLRGSLEVERGRMGFIPHVVVGRAPRVAVSPPAQFSLMQLGKGRPNLGLSDIRLQREEARPAE